MPNIEVNTSLETIALPNYTSYIAHLGQAGTSAPSALHVFSDTIEGVTFQRDDVGLYRIVSDAKFVSGKTIIPNPLVYEYTTGAFVKFIYQDSNTIYIQTYLDASPSDDVLGTMTQAGCPIEIRVYP